MRKKLLATYKLDLVKNAVWASIGALTWASRVVDHFLIEMEQIEVIIEHEHDALRVCLWRQALDFSTEIHGWTKGIKVATRFQQLLQLFESCRAERYILELINRLLNRLLLHLRVQHRSIGLQLFDEVSSLQLVDEVSEPIRCALWVTPPMV